MRKKFVNVALFGALLVASLSLTTSCKDYDDDVDNLQSQIDGMAAWGTQLQTLQTALNQANSDIAAAKAAGDAAAQAAAQAKADAITEAQALVEQLRGELGDYVKAGDLETYAKVEYVDAQIRAIEDGLDAQIQGVLTGMGLTPEVIETLKGVGDLQSILAQLETQQAAIENFTKLLGENGEVLDEKLQANLDAANAAIDAKIAEYATALQNCVTKSDLATELGKYYTSEQVDGLLTTVNGQITDLSDKIGTVETELGKKIDDLNKTLSDKIAADIAGLSATVDKVSGDLVTLLGKALRGLVFSPEVYYQGIEAVGVYSFNYNAKEVKYKDPNTADKNDQSDDVATEKKPLTNTSVVPIVEASYYLNPSSASVSMDEKRYSYVVNNAEYVRAVKENNITVDSVALDADKKGLLNVYFHIKDAGDIDQLKETGEGNVDVIALQYNCAEAGEDTVITSDFAALKHYKITDFDINKVNASGKVDDADDFKQGCHHLAGTAKEAVTDDTKPRLKITYQNNDATGTETATGGNGLDLDEWINVHYNYVDNKNQLWGGQKTVNKKQFKLVYELIGYIAKDTDGTNESGHATINGHILTVHGVGANAGSTGRYLIGRKPLVRVKLVDGNTNDQIAEVGYILVEIVDDAQTPTEPKKVENIDPVKDNYTVVCDDDVVLDGVTAVTWQDVENKILGELDMSKEEFEQNYEPEASSSGTPNACKQYEYKDGAFSPLDPNEIGEVINTEDPAVHETRVLQWTIKNQQAYDLFVTKNQTSISVWVKFVVKADAPDKDKGLVPVYVKLTWTPGTRNIAPKATIGNDDKKAADWHANDSRSEGFDDVHFQVGSATVPGATNDYSNTEVENTFIDGHTPGDIIKEDLGTTYKALADAATVTYKFAELKDQAMYKLNSAHTVDGASGDKYTLEVEADGTKIYATKTPGGTKTLLATIEGTTGKITLDENDVLKDILNKYTGDGDLQHALTFTVWVDNETCDPAKDLIVLENDKFDVKFIKPLFIESTEVPAMTWNNYSTLTQPLTLNFVDFNGYDPKEFADNSKNTVDFFDFYGVENAISIDGDVISTYTGKEETVPADNDDFKIEYTNPGTLSADDCGSLTLTQKKDSRSNAFDIKLTLKVPHKWGYLFTDVTLHVNAAPGN